MNGFRITTPIGSDDYELFKGIINQGIDAHLEAFTSSKFEEKLVNDQPRLVMHFNVSELPILVRRLEEIDTEEAESWAFDIKETDEYKLSITPQEPSDA